MKHSFQGNCMSRRRSCPPKLSKVRHPNYSSRNHRSHLPFSNSYRTQGAEDVNPTLNVLNVSRTFLTEMCRDAPKYCVPLLVHVPRSGLEKCCSVHRPTHRWVHTLTSLKRSYLMYFLLDEDILSNTA